MGQRGGLVLSCVHIPEHHMGQCQTKGGILSLGCFKDTLLGYGKVRNLYPCVLDPSGNKIDPRLRHCEILRLSFGDGLIKLHIGDDVEHLGHLVRCPDPCLQDSPERCHKIRIHLPPGRLNIPHPLCEICASNFDQLRHTTEGHEITLEGACVS